MSRKERKIITKEIYDLVVTVARSERYNVNEIATAFQIHRHNVKRILDIRDQGIEFIPANIKFKNTIRQKNSNLNFEEQALYNTMLLDNSFTQDEVKRSLSENNGI